MSNLALADRRSKPRYPTDGLIVSLRRRGKLHHLEAVAIDFNRHGIGLLLDQPIAKDSTVYLTLRLADAQVEDLLGVVHNCISLPTGYRCGVQFRTTSRLQLDQLATEANLRTTEHRFRTRSRMEA